MIEQENEVEDFSDEWFNRLYKNIETYPKRDDPLFQKYLEDYFELPFDEDWLFETIMLSLIIDGVLEIDCFDKDGEATFKRPVLI